MTDSSMVQVSYHNSVKQTGFSIGLKNKKNDTIIAKEIVTVADFYPALNEVWLECFLRKGFTQVSFNDVKAAIKPIYKKGFSDVCAGYMLESMDPSGKTVNSVFTIYSLKHVAERATVRAVESGLISADKKDEYSFILVTVPEVILQKGSDKAVFNLVKKQKDFFHISLSISKFVSMGSPVDFEDSKNNGNSSFWYPVFYTAEAFEKAEKYSRKGSEDDPSVESGAVLVGPVCSCPDSGELFSVVCDVIEINDVQQNKFSLSYTSRTWQRLQAVMRARQANPETQAHRILGQAHGHNFLPSHDKELCSECSKRDVCNYTSVFVSQSDQLWSRAVFAHQPWQLCHIFGHDVKGNAVNSLFGQKDCRLLKRDYYIIPQFNQKAAGM